MGRLHGIGVGFAGIAAAAFCANAAMFDLATAKVEIKGGNPTCRLAAEELERHLGLIAGSGESGGPSKAASNPSAIVTFVVGERPDGTPEPAPFESFARVCGDKVHFWGDDAMRGITQSKGTLFAVYEFLDRALGVRWVHPGDDGIVAPQRRTVELKDGAEWRFKPPFALNSIRIGSLRRFDEKAVNATLPEGLWTTRAIAERQHADQERWRDRMREISFDRFAYGHAFTDWQDRYLDTHPEYLGMDPKYGIKEKGYRGLPPRLASRFKFCLSNPDVPDLIIDDWKKRGAPKYLNVCPNDGTPGFCQCENCLKLDTRKPGEAFLDHLTDRYVWFWNRLAEKARAVRPDVKLIAYIYGYYRHPPRRERVEHPDNFIFGIVPALTDDYMAIYGAWRKAGMKHFFLRPNYRCYSAVFPRGLERYLYDNFRDSLASGMMGVDYDGCPRPVTDFEYYVIASLSAHPDKAFETIADEFYSQFGAAAGEARAYYEGIRERSRKSRASFVARVMDDNRHVQDDSELAKYAVLGHTLADLEMDIAKLKPGFAKQLLPVERARLSALALRAEHALLTLRFLAASKRAGKAGKTALAAAAKALHDFRVKNLHALGDEAASWYSKRNSEIGAWRKAGYLR